MSDNELITPSDWVVSDATIKVLGVGGGGCNAVTYMYEQGIEGCSFVVCNTDSQHLIESSVPTKIQLGYGLGAGTDPIKGQTFGTPCGACRQVMSEFMDANAPIILVAEGKKATYKLYKKPLKTFLPFTFTKF